MEEDKDILNLKKKRIQRNIIKNSTHAHAVKVLVHQKKELYLKLFKILKILMVQETDQKVLEQKELK